MRVPVLWRRVVGAPPFRTGSEPFGPQLYVIGEGIIIPEFCSARWADVVIPWRIFHRIAANRAQILIHRASTSNENITDCSRVGGTDAPRHRNPPYRSRAQGRRARIESLEIKPS